MSSNRRPFPKASRLPPTLGITLTEKALLAQDRCYWTRRAQKARNALVECRQALYTFQATGQQRLWIQELRRYTYWLSQYLLWTERN